MDTYNISTAMDEGVWERKKFLHVGLRASKHTCPGPQARESHVTPLLVSPSWSDLCHDRYTLFLTPLCLCIIINLVFFGMVAKVIKNSKRVANISDNERVLVRKLCFMNL